MTLWGAVMSLWGFAWVLVLASDGGCGCIFVGFPVGVRVGLGWGPVLPVGVVPGLPTGTHTQLRVCTPPPTVWLVQTGVMVWVVNDLGAAWAASNAASAMGLRPACVQLYAVSDAPLAIAPHCASVNGPQ
jgi:hypothetical protein